ncbi:hypothetical protein SUGI_0770280 [Cryptomeria japonica]|nr:hypothetical protein SUGI_0770280 [Cryptomeria japonica]
MEKDSSLPDHRGKNSSFYRTRGYKITWELGLGIYPAAINAGDRVDSILFLKDMALVLKCFSPFTFLHDHKILPSYTSPIT